MTFIQKDIQLALRFAPWLLVVGGVIALIAVMGAVLITLGVRSKDSSRQFLGRNLLVLALALALAEGVLAPVFIDAGQARMPLKH